MAEAEKYLGGWKGSKKREPLPNAAPPPLPDRDVALLHGARALTATTMTCRIPGRTVRSAPAHHVLREVLYRALWLTFRDQGLTYTPGVWIDTFGGRIALLNLHVEVPAGRGGDSAQAIAALLALVAGGAPDAVVDEARHTASMAFTLELADPTGSLGLLERHTLDGGMPFDLASYVDRVHAVTPADLSALLATCAGHEAYTVTGGDQLEDLEAAGLHARQIDWFGTLGEIVERLK